MVDAHVTSTPEAAATIARGARGWLSSLLERIPCGGDGAARAFCHVLIAWWIADKMCGRDADPYGFRQVATYVARTLNSLDRDGRDDPVKPTLILLVDILLGAEELTVEPFRDFSAQTASILGRTGPALEANRSLVEKHILLHSVGVLPPPAKASADTLRIMLEDFHLAASAAAVDALILELEYLTGWGTRPVEHGCIARGVGDLVAGLAVQRLRNYELIPAARLLRLAEYLAADGIMLRRNDIYGNLHLQHRRHGPFGWYGPEAAKLMRSSSHLSDNRDLLVAMELYLPATLECLWTLAEVSMNGWRLFERLPTYSAAGQSSSARPRPYPT